MELLLITWTAKSWSLKQRTLAARQRYRHHDRRGFFCWRLSPITVRHSFTGLMDLTVRLTLNLGPLTDTVISTINVSFEVLESATIMTTGQSEVYNNEMGNKMDEVNASITNQLKALQEQVDTASTLAKTAQASLDAITAAAKANSFATLSGDINLLVTIISADYHDRKFIKPNN